MTTIYRIFMKFFEKLCIKLKQLFSYFQPLDAAGTLCALVSLWSRLICCGALMKLKLSVWVHYFFSIEYKALIVHTIRYDLNGSVMNSEGYVQYTQREQRSNQKGNCDMHMIVQMSKYAKLSLEITLLNTKQYIQRNHSVLGYIPQCDMGSIML